MKKWILALVVLGFVGSAHAGKVDDLITAVKNTCGKDIDRPTAISNTQKAFLCNPGSKVDVAGCSIDCLKDNAGAVIGN